VSRPAALRLFLALWPDAAVRRRIAAHAAAWAALPVARGRMAPEDWHVTLHYIGSVAADRVPAVAEALEVRCEPFELVLDRPRTWPRGLAVVEAATIPVPLTALHEALAQSLRRLALPVEERRFRPHVTLARHAGDARPPLDPDPIGWPAHGYRLVVSTGRPEQRYANLREYRAEGQTDCPDG
jgi:2'-5' RNA ligase